MQRPRTLAPALIILLTAFLITWLSAWAIAWRARHDTRPAVTAMATATQRVGLDTILDSAAVNPRSPPSLGPWQWWRRYNTQAYDEFLSRSPNHPAGPPPAWTYPCPRGTFHTDTIGFGWPLIALRTRTTNTTPKDPIALNLGTTTLPLRPNWPGLAANTALYALLLSAAYLTIIRTRTTLRTRRGNCPNCGYNRAGLSTTTACPECGTT
jgi:hypothetical protein